jgi:hypothetical protein
VPVTVPVREPPLLAHGNPLNVSVPLTELPFWVNVPLPTTIPEIGDVAALSVPILQVPLMVGGGGFGGEVGIAPPPQPVIKDSAMTPVTRAVLTIESLAIDLIIILLSFTRRRLANVRGLALGMRNSFDWN